MESIKTLTHKNCSLARGNKSFVCTKCGFFGNNYTNGVDICYDCCVKDDICRICGKPLNPVLIYDNGREEADNILGINNILKPKVKKPSQDNKPIIVASCETEYKDPSIIDVTPLEYIEMFFIDDKGLQKMLSNKELFKQYELTICWTTGDKGGLWRIKPKKIYK